MQIELGYDNKGDLWKPRDFQIDMANKIKNTPVHACVIHRQAGKTEFGIFLLIDFLFRFNKLKNPKALVCMKSHDQTFDTYFGRTHAELRHLPEAIYMKRGGKDTGVRIYFHRPHFGDTATVIFGGVGNIDVYKGGTYDLMILDEMAYYPAHAWDEIFEPMIKARKGKAILTSTLQGRNHFYDMLMYAKDQEEKGNKRYSYINRSWKDTTVFSKEEMLETKKSAARRNKLYKFLQEYENDPDAASSEEAPFAMKVSLANEEGRFVVNDKHPVIEDSTHINVSVDIGKKGNCATWFWKQDSVDNSIIFMDYEDEYDGLKSLLNEVYEKYKKKYANINIIFPFDVMQPSMTEGKTHLANLQRHLIDNHMHRQVTLHTLPKVAVKEAMWVRGLQFWNRCYFNYEKCMRGIDKLSRTRFVKTKNDGIVTFGKPVDNGAQHAADAFLYVAAAVEENLHYKGRLDAEDYVVNTYSGVKDYRHAANKAKYYKRTAAQRKQRRYA